MKTFKDLIDTASVIWINEEVNEAAKAIIDDLENLNLGFLAPGMAIDKNDVQSQISSMKNQLSTLKTFADVIGFSKINAGGLNDLLKDGVNPEAISKMFSSGQAPNISKLLAKIQLGGVFESLVQNGNMIRDLMDKIGRDTSLSEVKQDDLDYLLNKDIKPEVEQLISLLGSTDGMLNEVAPEIKDLSINTNNWSKKKTDKDVIDIFVTKERNKFLNNPQKMGQLTMGVPLNSSYAVNGQKIISINNSLGIKIDFAYLLIKEFNKFKSN